MTERLNVAGHYHLAARTGHGHVQFAVYDACVVHEAVGCKKLKLPPVLHRERIDYHVALAALIALYGVYGYVFKFLYPGFSISLRITAIWLR